MPAITVDTLLHECSADKLEGSEASSAGVLPKDMDSLMADSDTIISITHCHVPTLNQILTTIVRKTA
tara:strand:- start:320 stop:520 length:201 start_codon:yes stop_codon:yes gene_type:complete